RWRRGAGSSAGGFRSPDRDHTDQRTATEQCRDRYRGHLQWRRWRIGHGDRATLTAEQQSTFAFVMVSPYRRTYFFMTRLILSLLFAALVFPVAAQREVRTYYDPAKEHVEEIYYVEADNETFTGPYKRYYESGGLMVEGSFEDGMKSGIFVEYYENGQRARELTYVSGVREGPVQVFDEEGNPVQQAYYRNDVLTDSVQLYYNDGSVKGTAF